MNKTTPLIHNMDNSKQSNTVPLTSFFLLIALVAIIGGLIGFGVSKLTSKTASSANKNAGKNIQTDTTSGISDKKTFKDSAEGILREGGIDGEGNFHLERPGGKSQNVYLTSSTVDLSLYLNKKVRVQGETFSAQTAGWLMDVGLVEILK